MSDIDPSIPSSWAPNETALDLWNERSYLDGVFIGAVGYGVHATLFFITMNLLLARPRTTWQDHAWIGYVVLMFIMSSVGNATQLKFTEMIWIDNRNFPGGPAVYFVAGSTDFMAVFCNSVYLVNTWFQDGLLLYRFWIIFSKSYLALVFPAIVYLANVALTCFLIFLLTQPEQTLWSTFAFFTSYWALTVSFNVILTAAIVTRLMIMRHKVGKAMTTAGPYVSVSAMLVESAFLYSAAALIFIISYAVNSPVQNLVLPVLGQITSIAPLLIIMRVARGQAWSADTAAQVTNPSFSFKRSGSTANTSATGGNKNSYALKSIPVMSGFSTNADTVTFTDSNTKVVDSHYEA